MATKVRQQEPDLHGQLPQVLRRRDRTATDLASGRGREFSLFTPESGSNLDVHVIELDAGSAPGRYHLHTTSETVYFILTGAISMRHAGGAVILRVGDAARFPTGVAHAATAAGGRRAVLLEIYAPAPADFVFVAEPDHSPRRS